MELADTLLGVLCSESAEGTEALGRRLGRLLAAGDIVGLTGELGAGKTCFARGVACGVAVPDEIYVSSPTFTLVHEYPGRLLLVHMDLYRIDEAAELVELGVDHYLGGEGACLIEWFDKFADELAAPALELRLLVTGDQTRRIEAHVRGADERHRLLARQWLDAGARRRREP